MTLRSLAADSTLSLERLDDSAAVLLNFERSHLGFSAQAGLWLNNPIGVEFAAGEVRLTEVNERIVEVPYAMAASASLPQNSRILDFGAVEGTLALSLASLGHQVTALDLRPYPLSHPNLQSVVASIENWEGPHQPLDAVFSVSTLEHVGLGAYGESLTDRMDLDFDIVDRFRGWLTDQGRLVLTVPYGRWKVDRFQRVYDKARLGELLEDWRVLDLTICATRDGLRWTVCTEEPSARFWDDARGVAMLTARPS